MPRPARTPLEPWSWLIPPFEGFDGFAADRSSYASSVHRPAIESTTGVLSVDLDMAVEHPDRPVRGLHRYHVAVSLEVAGKCLDIEHQIGTNPFWE